MRMKRLYERLRYSMLGNVMSVLVLLSFFFAAYAVLALIIANGEALGGLGMLLIVLYILGLHMVRLLANYHKIRRYQRAVYGIGAEKAQKAPGAGRPGPEARIPQPRLDCCPDERAVSRLDRCPDEKAMRRMERAREKEERALERARVKAERRERKENMKW